MSSATKAALYARVSTRDKGQDPEMQLFHLRKYADSRELTVFKEYVDHGLSGTKDNRPGLISLMEDARKKRFSVVIVYRFDRFARSVVHLVNALSEFNHLKIDFVSFNENIDTASPMGQAMFTIIGAMAQLERDIIAERVKSGLARARARGKRLGRPPVSITLQEIKEAQALGLSIRQLPEKLGVSKSTIERHLTRARSSSPSSQEKSQGE